MLGRLSIPGSLKRHVRFDESWDNDVLQVADLLAGCVQRRLELFVQLASSLGLLEYQLRVFFSRPNLFLDPRSEDFRFRV